MLTRNIDPTLDLMADVLFAPRWDEKEWTRIRDARKSNLRQAAEEPTSIARRVANRVMYGDSYSGRATTEASLDAITLDAMNSWHSERVVAQNALILVAGDTTLDDIVPRLEARFGKWAAGEAAKTVSISTIQPEKTVVYLVNKPGAAQSVIRAGRFVDGNRLSADYFALALGNAALGGMFTSRINMNLREDKGYTYGARSFLSNQVGPTLWGVSTSVKTATTIDSLKEIKRELEDPGAERPLTDDEINYVRGSMVQSFPAKFESPNYLLGERSTMWVYDLPDTWLDSYISNIEAPTADEARAALAKHVDPGAISIVVVGDLSTFSPGVYCLGWDTAHLDRDGNPLEAPEDVGCPEANE
jgi:zinc protease